MFLIEAHHATALSRHPKSVYNRNGFVATWRYMTHHAHHPTFAVTVDVTLFGLHHDTLYILLVQRKYPPFAGHWALPGGFVDPDEDLDTAALRELHEESGITPVWLRQLHTFGTPGRDPRRHTISVAHLGICTGTPAVTTSDETPQVIWHPIQHDIPLAFDHRNIVDTAITALRQHCHDLHVMLHFLPVEFSAVAVHHLYEQVLATSLPQAHFVAALQQYLAQHHVTPHPDTAFYRRPGPLGTPFLWDTTR